jgi:lipopolysaccharide export system protein LptC
MSAPHTAGRVRLAVIMALVAAAALGSFWILEVLRQTKNDERPAIPKGEPDYTVEKFNFVRMSTTGQARYNVSGLMLTHFPNDDSFEIRQPVLHNLTEGQAPTTLHAERAIVDHVKNQIHLHRNVLVERPASATSGVFRLHSEYLLVLPDDDIMKTDKPVEILSGTSQLYGTGMVANNATRELHLASKVHGTLQPPKQ